MGLPSGYIGVQRGYSGVQWGYNQGIVLVQSVNSRGAVRVQYVYNGGRGCEGGDGGDGGGCGGVIDDNQYICVISQV